MGYQKLELLKGGKNALIITDHFTKYTQVYENNVKPD